MRQALASQRPRRQQIVNGASIPAPVGGWNAQLPLAAMPIQDAVQLDNWIPRPGYVEVRKGYQPIVTDFGAAVESLIIYRGGGSGNDEIFAAAGDAIYDATTPGQVGSAEVSSLNSARWQYINFSNAAGNFVLAFNGADTPLKYDGATWGTNSISGSDLSSEDLIDAVAHKRRVFMVEQDTLHVWYLDIEAISGTATLLDVGPVFALGGTISAIGTWTIDGGQGADDMLVIVTDQGQVAVYQGIDPDDANEWSLIGVYTCGKPLGRRALIQYGSDLVLLTVNGVLPLSQALRFDRSQDSNVALTAKIQNAFALATASYGTNLGWEAFLYPNSQLAIFNVPITSLGTSYQFVQNMQTGAWAQWKGMNAFCWAYANGKAYFGSTIAVNQWDTGSSDNGTPITCDLCTAFTGFDRGHHIKQFTMIRPIVRCTNTIEPAVDVVTDYRTTVPTNTITAGDEAGGMRWGSMVWGSMVWGASNPLRLDWAGCTGVGIVGAARMRIVLSPAVNYFDILKEDSGDILLETGMSSLALETTTSATLRYEVIGFDVMYEEGGML